MIALFDLDGSLADYDTGMTKRLEGMRCPGEPTDGPWMDARKWTIRQDPNFWRTLDRLEGGYTVLVHLLSQGYDIHILTKGPQSSPAAWTAKLEWVREYLGDFPVTMCAQKSMIYGNVLYDDWPAYVDPWLTVRPRGKVIMPDRPYNADYSHPRCLRLADTPSPDLEAIDAFLEAA